MRKRKQKDDLLYYQLRTKFNNKLNHESLSIIWSELADALWNPVKNKLWYSLKEYDKKAQPEI